MVLEDSVIKKRKIGQLKKYFEETDWTKFKEVRGVVSKWKEFVEIYNEGVQRYIPKVRGREGGHKV